MRRILLTDIPFEPNLEHLLRQFHLAPDDDDALFLRDMCAEAKKIAVPKVLCGTYPVRARTRETVTVAETVIHSHLLSENLQNQSSVFPYVATCGTEIWAWAESFTDVLERYWAVDITRMALRTAMRYYTQYFKTHIHDGPTASQQPGSLLHWHISGQASLFTVLGDVKGDIGVRLSESFQMVPNSSNSGIRFPNTKGFSSCRVCLADCSGRSHPYDETEAKKRIHAVGIPQHACSIKDSF